MAQDHVQWQILVLAVMNLCVLLTESGFYPFTYVSHTFVIQVEQPPECHPM